MKSIMIHIKTTKHKKLYISVLSILVIISLVLILLHVYFSIPKRVEREDASLTWSMIPAFPFAEGFGSLTPGGRYNPITGQDGTVIKVTTLNDSGPGSLREAINTKGPRIIVFEVSGIIELQQELAITEPFVTIAGQTAPGDGICLKNYGMTIMASNVVIRFIRSRPGDVVEENADNIDSLAIIGLVPRDTFNVIIDHCSLSWSQDETFSTWYSVHDITIQWCILSEGLNRAFHPKETHSMGILVGDGGDNVTLHHNLDAHHIWRNPLLTGGSLDYFNNIHYNFERGMELDYQHSFPLRLNIVGNKWIPGPNTTLEFMPTIIIYQDIPNVGAPKIFLNDNQGPKEGNIADWAYDYDLIGPTWEYLQGTEKDEFIAYYSVNQIFPERPHVTIQPRDEAFEDILQLAGASLIRDDTDLRIIDDVVYHTGKAIDSVNEVGGWSSYEQTEVPLDSDGDGIPDSWENDNGLNYLDSSDNWNDEDGNGYVEIEEYINFLVNHLYPEEPLPNHDRKNVNQHVKIFEVGTSTHHFEDLHKELIIIQLIFSSNKQVNYISLLF